MLQLHFPSGSLETSECAPIFADVLKRRLAAGLWLYIIHIPVEVQVVHKDCQNCFCLAHCRTLGRNLSNGQFSKPGKRSDLKSDSRNNRVHLEGQCIWD